MRLTLLSSAAVALALMAAPQLAAAQSASSGGPDSVRNPDAQTPVTKAQSPISSGLDAGNSADASAQGAADTSAASSDASATAAVIPATSVATDASATITTSLVTNGPVADTPENRAKYGAPLSNAGKRTAPRGN
jgi:hypothetical protein